MTAAPGEPGAQLPGSPAFLAFGLGAACTSNDNRAANQTAAASPSPSPGMSWEAASLPGCFDEELTCPAG